MKIGFDARCLEEAHISGVGEYALELLKNLLETDKKNEYIVFSNSFKQTASREFRVDQKIPECEAEKIFFSEQSIQFLFLVSQLAEN